jgi:lipopolysaccharide/colanic/teichoic acid biosynthesis glycosyltransferase
VYGSRNNRSSQAKVTGGGYPLKRLFDLLVVLAGLLISSPMWLVFSVLIKLGDRGPILFTQERWGQNQSRIRVYKFRTMVPNAIEKFGNIQAQENDPRVTRVGHFLRATSLDEMPQLLNILKGDMSWVGPRALPIDEIQAQGEDADLPDAAIPGFAERARLRPGLTGIAQIFAPRDVPRRQKYQYDAIYADRQSLWLDIRLIFLSLWITLRARWESRESKV